MNKKTIRIISIILTMLMAIVTLTSSVFAFSPDELEANTQATGTPEVQSFGENIMGVIQVAAVVIAVVILMVLGIKYMMGSAEEKAEYKKTMIPYIVGAILVFAAGTVANIIYEFAIGIQG